MENLAYLGMACALCFSALGSGFGTGVAGQAAVGGWKKCYAAGKPAPFIPPPVHHTFSVFPWACSEEQP